MANEISLVTASGRTVTPKDDGIIYEVFSPGNGIIYGGAVTIKDSSTLHITAGHGIVCGRKFTIDDSDIPVSLSGSGSLLGRLYIHLDLADAADPITLLVETGASLTPVVQDADVNINNGVYEINIATFDVDTSTISNLVNLDVTVAPMGDMEGATAGTDGKGGYVPAPQAGDEDKVLRGDGTWGSAGDTATVRYVPLTDMVQCWDGTQWKDWKTAGLNLNPLYNNGVLCSYLSPLTALNKDVAYINQASQCTYLRNEDNKLCARAQGNNASGVTGKITFILSPALDLAQLSQTYTKLRFTGYIHDVNSLTIPGYTITSCNAELGLYDVNGDSIVMASESSHYDTPHAFVDDVALPSSGVGYIGVKLYRASDLGTRVIGLDLSKIELV